MRLRPAAIRRNNLSAVFWSAFVALLSSLAAPLFGDDGEQPKWFSDLTAAEKHAKEKNRPLLLHFHARWCAPCLKMDKETFSSGDFRKQAKDKFVLVRINADRNPDLMRRYGVKALPTDVFVTPSGRILSRSVGYRSTRKYLTQLAQWETRFAKWNKIQTAGAEPKHKSNPQAGDTDEKDSPSGGQRSQPRDRPLIGMDGYSPVAMHRHRKWVAGKAEFAWIYQGVTYWMADPAELAAFKANPRKFAPSLLGCDPVILQETDRAVPGKTRYGALFDGRLFFFTSSATRKRFRENPLRYTRTRHVLRVEEIGGTVQR